jgi:hypothetical protein
MSGHPKSLAFKFKGYYTKMSFLEQMSFELKTLEQKIEHLGNSSVQNKSDFHQNVFRANAI